MQDEHDVLLEEVRRYVATSIGTRQALNVGNAVQRIAEKLPHVPRSEILETLVKAAGPAQIAVRFESRARPLDTSKQDDQQ